MPPRCCKCYCGCFKYPQCRMTCALIAEMLAFAATLWVGLIGSQVPLFNPVFRSMFCDNMGSISELDIDFVVKKMVTAKYVTQWKCSHPNAFTIGLKQSIGGQLLTGEPELDVGTIETSAMELPTGVFDRMNSSLVLRVSTTNVGRFVVNPVPVVATITTPVWVRMWGRTYEMKQVMYCGCFLQAQSVNGTMGVKIGRVLCTGSKAKLLSNMPPIDAPVSNEPLELGMSEETLKTLTRTKDAAFAFVLFLLVSLALCCVSCAHCCSARSESENWLPDRLNNSIIGKSTRAIQDQLGLSTIVRHSVLDTVVVPVPEPEKFPAVMSV